MRAAPRHHAERDEETRRAAALTERWSGRARRRAIVALKAGSHTRRVAESDILYVRAADDYCEAILAGRPGRAVTTTLARLLETLPPPLSARPQELCRQPRHVAGDAPKRGVAASSG